MVKFLIVLLLLAAVTLKAQRPMTYQISDSMTYSYYLKGDWEKLINTGKASIGESIDYKRLRQRMGYAYFAKRDYYEAQTQYEKALAFDEYDPDSREYLYYSVLNTGNPAYARFIAEKLPPELKKKMGIRTFKPVDAVDLEYNFKNNDSQTRTNPTYLRAGICTQLGYRLQLYQSVSNYRQTVDTSLTKQPEYFALLTWSATSKITVDAAYHYLNTSVAGYQIPGHLAFAAISANLQRVSLGVNGSILNSNIENTSQFGIYARYAFPGRTGLYLKSSLNEMGATNANRTVFSQVAGMHLLKNIWAEGNVILGNLKNYNNYKSLYVYNSLDPTTFRSGFTLFWYPGKKSTFFMNYTYDRKQITSTLNNYNQHSFSGGIIWKL